MLPQRIKHKSDKADRGKRSPAHRAWVRGFACCACGAHAPIECAHVRTGTDGGMGVKPSDAWCIALCRSCHQRQHQIGEVSFEAENGINLIELAKAFFSRSPHKHKIKEPDNGLA